jgi:hypothetical protein
MLVCVQVAASIDVLIDHPDQWNLLRDNPELALPAVDETMRHSPIVGATMRITTEDVELAGVVIPAGTIVLTNTAAANRDPAIYDDPNRFGITRQGLPPILTFGAGVHYCLGANLARLEIAEALKTVTRRMPNPRRTGPAPWKPLAALSGPTSLPIPSTLRLVAAGGPLFSTPSSSVDDLEKHDGPPPITRPGHHPFWRQRWLTPQTHVPLLRRSAWLSPLRLHLEDRGSVNWRAQSPLAECSPR